MSIPPHTALHAQRRPNPAPPHDQLFARLVGSEPDYADPKTRRLEVLTEIWGNAGLYHPLPSAARLNWDHVLADAVGALRSVRTEREFADMLNRVVFGHY